jgi:hypothetical protein
MYQVTGPGWTGRTLNADDLTPRYTGPNLKDSKYYSPSTSDANLNPALRFGHRWSVAGHVTSKVLEFGFEDDSAPYSDMDFDDIIFQTQGLGLIAYEKSARKRSYIW